jgi:hypothetical protein
LKSLTKQKDRLAAVQECPAAAFDTPAPVFNPSSRTPYRSRAKLQSRQQVRVLHLATAETEKVMSKKPKLLIVAAMIAVLGSSSQALARGGTFHLNSFHEQAENR